MRAHFICGCGGENYTWEDWISHFKYGRKYRANWLWRAVRNLLLTRIEVKR